MQANRTLGNYDMALSLSISKINHQFKIMQRRGLIGDSWAFLTDSTGRDTKTITEDQVEQYLNHMQQLRNELSEVRSKKEQISQEINKAIENDDLDTAKALISEKKALDARLQQIETELKKDEAYDLGMIAQIDPPAIELLKQNHSELRFKITLLPGSYLFFRQDSKVMKYDLGTPSVTYAFRVNLGKVHITSNEKIVDMDEHGTVKQVTLADKGISDADFTIESLFLDFENSNVTDYDPGNSKLTPDMKTNNLLQAALGNYFKNLKGTDNPYILGYGVTKRTIKEGEQAMFYPTGVSYSSSFSNQDRASSFNFLMLTNHHPFPTSGDSGILPTALMERSIDKTATVNAMFGINKQEFESVFIPELTKALAKRLRVGSQVGSAAGAKSFSVPLSGHNIKNGKLSAGYTGITQENNGKGIAISYEINAEATVHQEIKEIIGTVGVDWLCSTKGRSKGTHGHSGTLKIILQAGAGGRLQLTPSYETPLAMGFDTDKPIYKDGLDEIWNNLNKFIHDFLKVLFFIETDIGQGLGDLSRIDNLANTIRIDQLENLNKRVILPVSSVYMFKNVQLLSKAASSDDVILFDASYGVVS